MAQRYFDEATTDFLHNVSVKHYMNIVLLDAVFAIAQMDRMSGDDQDYLAIKKFVTDNPDINSLINKLTDEQFTSLASNVSVIHDKYIWRQYHTDTGRLVSMVVPEFKSIKRSHNLFRNMREKILNHDLFNSFATFSKQYKFVQDKTRNNFKFKRIAVKQFDSFLSPSVKEKRYGKTLLIVPSMVEYYNKYCSFGIIANPVEAVQRHSHPDNMVTFDISKFFNRFTTERVKKMRLFERIYECVEDKTAAFTTRGRQKNKCTSAYERNAEFFYLLFDAFSCKGNLPTGATFAPDITNLLFFSVDMEVRNVIKAYLKDVDALLGHEYVPSSSDQIMVYTRYIDDIAISVNLKNLARTLRFRKSVILSDSSIKKFFINIDIVKKIEAIFNKYEFFLKYDKTKIYSYKMDKTYLGFRIVNRTRVQQTGPFARHPRGTWVQFFCDSANYEIIPYSDRKHEFRKKFYVWDSLNQDEKNSVRSAYHSFGPGRNARVFVNNTRGTPYYVFELANRNRRYRKYFYRELTSNKKRMFRSR